MTLDPDAAVNSVQVAHYEPTPDGLPALHVLPVGLLAETMLPDVIDAAHLCLTFEDPHEDCEPQHRQSGTHQHLRLHLNAGTTYGHEDCLVSSACVGCQTEMLEAITTRRTGWIRRYIPQGHRWVGQARFTLVNVDSSLDALATTRSRLTAAEPGRGPSQRSR